MDFTHFAAANKGKTATRLTVVTAFHAVLAIALVHAMNRANITIAPPETIVTLTPPTLAKPLPPPPKVEPRKVTQKKIVITDIVAPVPPPVQNPPPDPIIEARQEEPTKVETIVALRPQAEVSGRDGKGMHTAVLADANACQKPGYPAAAQRNGDTGTTTLALLVGTDGRVTDAKVQKSSGSRELDRAARNALSLCQFKPAMNDGVPQEAWTAISYVWSLD